MPNPKINPLILLAPLEDGYAAYDPARDRLHQLNPIAALLAELCDGTRSVAAIRDLAAPLMPDGRGEEIDRWIDDGIKAGLLVWVGAQNGPPPSAKERAKLELRSALFCFRHLKQTEKIDAALQVAKDTVRANPRDWGAWHDIGKIAQCLGRHEEARAAYGRYFEAHPEDGEVEQLLAALDGGAPPPRASDRAVQHIYRKFAASYDARMREDLQYAGPERLQGAIAAVDGGRTGLSILDLGCGSGLSGTGLRDRAGQLAGIDLSPEMIELARARNLYDRLEVAEITEWLNRDRELFDIIVCCDSLIYFGDLAQVLRPAAARLKQGGFIAISMERGGDYPFRLAGTGRYVHHPDHVRDVAAACGLAVAQMGEDFLRMEAGEKVTGLFAILNRPA